jgi:hypothetical protein
MTLTQEQITEANDLLATNSGSGVAVKLAIELQRNELISKGVMALEQIEQHLDSIDSRMVAPD